MYSLSCSSYAGNYLLSISMFPKNIRLLHVYQNSHFGNHCIVTADKNLSYIFISTQYQVKIGSMTVPKTKILYKQQDNNLVLNDISKINS